jgi:hypothetical protein
MRVVHFIVVSSLLSLGAFVPSEASADGPPPGSLAPDSSALEEAARSAAVGRALAGRDGGEGDEASRAARPLAARHATLRNVALVAGLGCVAVAVWRGAVASDRSDDYDRAIFSSSASALRRSVRDAEIERNVAAAAAALAFSVTLLTFVY